MRTVADKIALIDAWRDRVWERGDLSNEEKASILTEVDEARRSLQAYEPRMRLITLEQALDSEMLEPYERQAIRWQMRRHIGVASFESAKWEMLTRADEDNLDICAKAFPDEVRAIREWRYGDLAKRLRRMPLEFGL